MKEKDWGLGLVEKTGALLSNAFFCKVAPSAKRRILEEHEGKGGLGEMRFSYRGTEVEVVRKFLSPLRKGLSFLGVRPIGEPLQPVIPLSRGVIREIKFSLEIERNRFSL